MSAQPRTSRAYEFDRATACALIADGLRERYLFTVGRIRHHLPSRLHDAVVVGVHGDDDREQCGWVIHRWDDAPVLCDGATVATAVRATLAARPEVAIVYAKRGVAVDFVKRLRRTEDPTDAPITLLVSAYEDEHMALMTHGADILMHDHVDKPAAFRKAAYAQAMQLARLRNRAHVMERGFEQMFNMAEHNQVLLGWCTPSPEAVYVYVNRAWSERFQAPYEVVAGRSVTEYGHFIAHERNAPELLTDMVAKVAASDADKRMLWYQTDGVPRTFFYGTSSIWNARDRAGRQVAACFSTHDNTDLKNALERCESLNASLEMTNDKLQRSLRIKDDFLASTSHEMRTPLNGIIGLSESLLDVIGDDETTRKMMQMVLHSGRRMNRVIDAVLALTDLRNGTHRMAMERCNAMELVRSAAAQVGRDRRPPIEVIEAALPVVTWDANQIQGRALAAMIDNALKFSSPDGPPVRVEASIEASVVSIDVVDRGRGVAEHMRDAIFEPFRQEDGSGTRAAEGVGVGLTIARHIAELHGGTLTLVATSQTPAICGSRFRLSLPIVARSDDAADIVFHEFITEDMPPNGGRPRPSLELMREFMPERDVPTGGGCPRPERRPSLSLMRAKQIKKPPAEYGAIATAPLSDDDGCRSPALSRSPSTATDERIEVISVDDDEINHVVVESALPTQRYRVTRAMSGDEALALLRQRDFDLMLLDEMMPSMTGTDVCRAVRAANKRKPIIVMLSGKDDQTFVSRAFEEGIDDYMRKPLRTTELVARIGRHLQRRCPPRAVTATASPGAVVETAKSPAPTTPPAWPLPIVVPTPIGRGIARRPILPWPDVHVMLLAAGFDEATARLYADTMRAHALDLQELASCDDDDLRRAGVDKLGHVKRIRMALRPYRL